MVRNVSIWLHLLWHFNNQYNNSNLTIIIMHIYTYANLCWNYLLLWSYLNNSFPFLLNWLALKYCVVSFIKFFKILLFMVLKYYVIFQGKVYYIIKVILCIKWFIIMHIIFMCNIVVITIALLFFKIFIDIINKKGRI